MLVLIRNAILDLIEFGADPGIIFIPVGVQSGERFESLFWMSMIDEPTWRFGKEENETGENDGREHLESQGQAPLCRVAFDAYVCSVTDPSGDESTNSQHELLQGCDATSNAGMGNFGLV